MSERINVAIAPSSVRAARCRFGGDSSQFLAKSDKTPAISCHLTLANDDVTSRVHNFTSPAHDFTSLAHQLMSHVYDLTSDRRPLMSQERHFAPKGRYLSPVWCDARSRAYESRTHRRGHRRDERTLTPKRGSRLSRVVLLS